jgi:hypothetical protein
MCDTGRCYSCGDDLRAHPRHVRDNESGAHFCDATCHYLHFHNGDLLPVTQSDEIALARVKAWHAGAD